MRRAWTVVGIGLVAGTLDISENILFNATRHVTPAMIFRFIASGLIGNQAFHMGWVSIALGVEIHYTIAVTWTVVFYFLSRRFPALLRRAALSGLLYGAAVYLIMNVVVLPLTAVPHSASTTTAAARISGVLALLFCIGLTIALLTRRFAPAE